MHVLQFKCNTIGIIRTKQSRASAFVGIFASATGFLFRNPLYFEIPCIQSTQ